MVRAGSVFGVWPSIATTAESPACRSSVSRVARTCSSRQLMAWIASASSGNPTTGSTCSGALP